MLWWLLMLFAFYIALWSNFSSCVLWNFQYAAGDETRIAINIANLCHNFTWVKLYYVMDAETGYLIQIAKSYRASKSESQTRWLCLGSWHAKVTSFFSFLEATMWRMSTFILDRLIFHMHDLVSEAPVTLS